MRFDGNGEALLAAHVTGVLAGIGGLTNEPILPGALRVLRFYVRPLFRRAGDLAAPWRWCYSDGRGLPACW